MCSRTSSRPTPSPARRAIRCCPTCRRSPRPGLPGFELEAWVGLFAPAGTPPAVVAKMSEAVKKVLDMPETKQRAAAARHRAALPRPGRARRARQEGHRLLEQGHQDAQHHRRLTARAAGRAAAAIRSFLPFYPPHAPAGSPRAAGRSDSAPAAGASDEEPAACPRSTTASARSFRAPTPRWRPRSRPCCAAARRSSPSASPSIRRACA